MRLVVLLLTAATLTATGAAAAERPNIVFILADDLSWADLGCYGHRWHRTPNLDRLASEGMRFTSGYSPAPICSAARASILTGKTAARLGFEFVTKNEPGHQRIDLEVPLRTPPFTLNLPLSEATIAEQLAALDYQTAFFGKWHVNQHYQRRYLAWHPEFGPTKQGFGVAVEGFGDHPYAWGKRQPADAPDGVIPDDTMFQDACNFIGRKHDRPYFAMVSTYYVHTPVKTRCQWLVDEYASKVPADAVNRSQRIDYAAFVETLDHHVGKIIAAVDRSPSRENTLIFFMSDNGGHPLYSANKPLRGSKWNLYEGGIRVPMIARWPAVIAAASTCDTPVIGYDLLPTLVELAGGEATKVDGFSFRRLLSDPTQEIDRNLLWHFPYYHPERGFAKAGEAIGVNDFAVSRTRPQSAIRRGRYKLLHFAEDDRVELYDLEEDRSESNDLSAKLPDVAADLRRRLETELARMNARRAVSIANGASAN